jgi:hypothetical protein
MRVTIFVSLPQFLAKYADTHAATIPICPSNDPRDTNNSQITQIIPTMTGDSNSNILIQNQV